MNAYTSVQSYNQYGGHATISILGHLIEDRLGPIDHGIAEFESVACFRTKAGPRHTLDDLYADFHGSLSKLPTSRWEAKRSRLLIRYESSLGTADDILNDREVSIDLLRRALHELASVVERLGPKLRKKRGLDIALFLRGLKGLDADIPGTPEALVAFRDDHSARKREAIAKLPWDERLEIDWSDYHPNSRRLLDDPFFWSNTHDFSPHGNDTGADLLPDYRRWNTRNPGVDSWKFLMQLFGSWGMDAVIRDFRAKDPSQYSGKDSIAMTVHDDAVVALAFAEIKLRGRCSSRIAVEAINSARRQIDLAVYENMGWSPPSEERILASQILEQVLQHFTT